MDTKNFQFSPWHVYTFVFIGFWISTAFFQSFLSTLVLCILFGILADYLNNYMLGGGDYDLNKRVVKEKGYSQHYSASSSHCLVDDDTYYAPTKPLPPEPEDNVIESDSEDEKNRYPYRDDSETRNSDLVANEHISKDLGADLLDTLDEYDKHPVPESVEFLDTNITRNETEVMFKSDILDNQLESNQDEAYNNDDNTSPSQDSSFQMLDIGSDSDIGKPNQDDILSDSKDAIATSSKEDNDSIGIMDNDISENSVQSLVQFTDNSNVDSQDHKGFVGNGATDNDLLRQKGKEFVEEIMEEALTITSEKPPENSYVSPQDDMEDLSNVQNDTVEDKSSQSSSPPASPRDLMDELLDSVPPPPTSPPEEKNIDIQGEVQTDLKEVENTKELEELLCDAQKDEGATIGGNIPSFTERKDSSSEYDEDNNDNEEDEPAEEDAVLDKEKVSRRISSDYEEENHDEKDDDAFGEHTKDQKETDSTRKSSSSEYEEENDAVGHLVPNQSTPRNVLRKRDSSSDYDDGNDNDAVDEHMSSESDIDEEMDIKTKTLADMDEGDPWKESCKEDKKDNLISPEFSDDNIREDLLQHNDSEDLPAQDDMSHRAVYGDDDDRNDEDVLLLDENEDEAKEREKENRKLSTTVPSLIEENETLGLKNDFSSEILATDLEDIEQSKNVPSIGEKDSIISTEIETAMEAKEGTAVVSDDFIKDDFLSQDKLPQAEETSPKDPLDINLEAKNKGIKEEQLIDF